MPRLERGGSRFESAQEYQWEGAASWLVTGPENQGDRKVRGSIPPPSANPERASRQAHCDRLLTGSSPRVSVSNTGRSANPILSMQETSLVRTQRSFDPTKEHQS